MEYVRLGSSGLKVSRIGLGMMSYGDPSLQSWALPEDEAEPLIRAAVESGITLFDTAYQIHRFDPTTPVEETMQALDDLVRAGKVRYIGASAMYAWQLAKLQHCATTNGWTRFVSMQNRYNLVNREDERELIPTCLDMGVGMLPYSPLARGLLAGTRNRSGERRTKRSSTASPDRPADFDVQDAVLEAARHLDVPPARVAMAWLLYKPGICAPIVGATARAHIADAIASLDVDVSEHLVSALEDAYLPRLLSDFS